MLKVFLNYAAEDRAMVRPYFDRLKAVGFDPWMDRTLLPGQDWNHEIQRAFTSADVILIFMSPRSVNKRGYVQREINDALDRLRYLLPGDIGVIPLLLEDCDVPAQISSRLQYIRIPQGWPEVLRALEAAAEQRRVAIDCGISMGPFRAFLQKAKHKWEGCPGYDVEMSFPRFESTALPETAFELNSFVSARVLDCVLGARRARIEQDNLRFGKEMGEAWAANYHDLSIEVSLVSDRIVSLVANSSGYNAGAAHGFHNRSAFNFVIEDDALVHLELADLFVDPYEAVKEFSRLCVEALKVEHRERFEQEPDGAAAKDFENGAGPQWKKFHTFSLTTDGLNVYFPPYQVACYAAGDWTIKLGFEELGAWLKPGGWHEYAPLATVIHSEEKQGAPRWDS